MVKTEWGGLHPDPVEVARSAEQRISNAVLAHQQSQALQAFNPDIVALLNAKRYLHAVELLAARRRQTEAEAALVVIFWLNDQARDW